MIKIDMEMPESCFDCMFCSEPWSEYECSADNTGNVIDDVQDRPYWCPLIEVKE